MTIELAEAKLFCRIETDQDDTIVSMMIASATDYVRRIGVDTDATPMPDSVTLAILMLVSFFYDHRDAFMAGMSDAQGAIIDRLLAPVREMYV